MTAEDFIAEIDAAMAAMEMESNKLSLDLGSVVQELDLYEDGAPVESEHMVIPISDVDFEFLP